MYTSWDFYKEKSTNRGSLPLQSYVHEGGATANKPRASPQKQSHLPAEKVESSSIFTHARFLKNLTSLDRQDLSGLAVKGKVMKSGLYLIDCVPQRLEDPSLTQVIYSFPNSWLQLCLSSLCLKEIYT